MQTSLHSEQQLHHRSQAFSHRQCASPGTLAAARVVLEGEMPTVTAPGEERWNRGCSVLGLNNVPAEFHSPGVLIHNFTEDRAGLEMAATGKHHLGLGAPFNATSTQRRSYQPVGPEELSETSHRHDKRLETKGVGGDLLMRHGNFSAPRETFYATMNQLTLPEHREHGEPRVATYVWNDSNKHNRTVPLNTGTLGLTARKQQQWEAEGAAGPFNTTTRDGLISAALQSAAYPHKQGTIKLAAEPGAHLPMVGRKPVGPHADECDKTYRRTGLRDVHIRGNVA